jgi:hypothetical protein
MHVGKLSLWLDDTPLLRPELPSKMLNGLGAEGRVGFFDPVLRA